MKIIQLPDVLYQYLLQLIEAYTARGIHPEEGLAVNRLYDAVKNHVTTLPDTDIERMSAGAPLSGDQKETNRARAEAGGPSRGIPECPECFDEEGSYACVRPAHQKAKFGAPAGN